MRKALFRHELESSIIIIQDKVYENLSQDLCLKFQTVDLKANSISVRDDPEARFLFYSLVGQPAEIPASIAKGSSAA